MRLALCSSLTVAVALVAFGASPVAADELFAMAVISAERPSPSPRFVEKPSAQHPSARASRASPSSGLSLSTCFPARWAYDEGAISLSYGFAGHFAVRANVSSYKVRTPFLSEASASGRERDVGAGLVWYPRRLWSGLTLELGAIVRSHQSTITDIFADYETETTDATLYAGRGLVGWSWHLSPVFVSVAGGLSLGRFKGVEHLSDDYRESLTRHFNRRGCGFESYFRHGFTFDL